MDHRNDKSIREIIAAASGCSRYPQLRTVQLSQKKLELNQRENIVNVTQKKPVAAT